jgi:hypothetical protein
MTHVPATVAAFSVAVGVVGVSAFLVQVWQRFPRRQAVTVTGMSLLTWAGTLVTGTVRGQPWQLVSGAVGSLFLGLLLCTRGRVDRLIRLDLLDQDFETPERAAHDKWQFQMVLLSFLGVGVYGTAAWALWQI